MDSTSSRATSSNPTDAVTDSELTKPIPRLMINKGVKNKSTTEIVRALRLDPSLLSYALTLAVSKGSVSLTRYLLTTESASVHELTPMHLVGNPSVELLDVVVSAGWDLNRRFEEFGMKMRLLDLLSSKEDLVKWCLEHGAQISDGIENENPFKCWPLTESVAGVGTVSCFKLIRAKGARIGRKTLHVAVERAAMCHVSSKPTRMAMVRFLVEEERLDVNQMDTDKQLENHWGTPIAYAAKESGGEDVVRYLLKKGADPTIKDCMGDHNALSLADFYKNYGVGQALREATDMEDWI
ncbi:hypothetical protein MMC07_003915 [Pseudocyphellaria aurata]|nr:hypothetical protein [Pseudocyphellaria aurata]